MNKKYLLMAKIAGWRQVDLNMFESLIEYTYGDVRLMRIPIRISVDAMMIEIAINRAGTQYVVTEEIMFAKEPDVRVLHKSTKFPYIREKFLKRVYELQTITFARL